MLVAEVQVPGSIEEEGLFSKLVFTNDEQSNRLEAKHLSVCLLLALKGHFQLYRFPLFPQL
eukprot:scaffold201782_cov18-Tisochrysis_lutea.AAC.2